MPLLDAFTLERWRRLCLDCAALLDGWGDEMRRLGWTVEDGFGVHPTASATAFHCQGLGLLLDGGSVIEMTAVGAKLQMRTGVMQGFTRRAAGGSVPVWMVVNAAE